MKPKKNQHSTFFGSYLYDIIIPEDSQFRLLLSVIDWNSIRKELLTDSENQPIIYPTMGRPAYDPIIIYKLLLLQRWHPASDEKVEERAKTDLNYRYFLKVPIPEPIPDSSTISRYRNLWGDEKINRISQNIFKQIQAFGYANVSDGIVGDLTHQFSKIKKPTARSLILNCFEKWLKEIQALVKQFPSIFDQKQFGLIQLDFQTWFIQYQEKIKAEELSRSDRFSELVQKILEVKDQVQRLLDNPLPAEVIQSTEWTAFFKRKTTLEQVLDENVTYDEEQIKQKKGERKIISDVDPEARSGYKNKKKRFTGNKIEATMTNDGFIASAETIPGDVSDANRAGPMADKAIEVSGEIPESMALDSAFDSVTNRQELHAKGIQPGIVNKKKTNPRNPNLYSTEEFELDVETLTVTCPAQEQTSKRTVNKENQTQTFRFPKQVCENCSQRQSCTTSKTGRTVTFTTELELLAHDEEYLNSPEYENQRKFRWVLEGKFGEAKVYHNLEKTPYHGLEKSSVHNRLVFTVLNLKRLIRLLFFPPTPPVPPLVSGASVF